MPIPVRCPGCKAEFKVSDKFAGKQGPCPKCKATISIPKLDKPGGAAGAPEPEVKIHGPEEAAGQTKTKTGQPTFKPLARRETRVSTVGMLAAVVTLVALIVGAVLLGPAFRLPSATADEEDVVIDIAPGKLGPPPSAVVVPDAPLALEEPTGDPEAEPTGSSSQDLEAQRARERALEAKREAEGRKVRPVLLRALALLVIAPVVVWFGYRVLRDEELEPHSGRSLVVRSAITAVVFALTWLIPLLVPGDLRATLPLWIVLAPAMIAAGVTAAYFALDLSIGASTILYVVFLGLVLGLAGTAGLEMPWHDLSAPPAIPTYPTL